jgi:amidase
LDGRALTTSSHFDIIEATIDSIHSAFQADEISCSELIDQYLARIEAYDKQGPRINSVMTINTRASYEARVLDHNFIETKKLVGPLHGIPVLVKDAVETKDLRTTFGSSAFQNYLPRNDATVIRKLRAAGAIILGKTNVPDWSASWFCFSSAGGETKNPYALDRNPGGSSGGTGAAVAANFATVGVGTDSGGSIRVPSSFCNLVGVRVTHGLISRNGTSPLVELQDNVGPMTRTVKDAAAMLDIMVGYDPTDPATAAQTCTRIPRSYTDYLARDGLKEARIGIVREVFGSDQDPNSSKVNAVINKSIETMRTRGAEIEDPVKIPYLQESLSSTALYIQSKRDINSFIAERQPGLSIEELFGAKRIHPLLLHPHLSLLSGIVGGPTDPETDPDYFRRVVGRERFRSNILNVMAFNKLDAIAYPDVQVLPPLQEQLKGKWPYTELTFPTNTRIASQTGLPAISLPAGFTEEGIPVGLELVGKSYDETTLIKLAASLEEANHARKPPKTVPSLPIFT